MADCATRPDTAAGPADSGGTARDEEVVNLSGMASEGFWYGMRDVRAKGDARRTAPPHRWVGMVTCRCVRQAVAVYSLQRSPEPATWPPYIGHTEIALQRAVCVDEPLSVAELWSSPPPSLRWSYVPLIAWLKPYPAHSPMLLPLGLVPERDFMQPKEPHLTHLVAAAAKAAAAAPPPPPRELNDMLPGIGRPQPAPKNACGTHACHAAGWCGTWSGPWKRRAGKPKCRCLADWLETSSSLRNAHRGTNAARWSGPGAAQRAGCPAAPRPWEPGMERARWARSPAQMAAHDAEHDRFGTDRWRTGHGTIPRAKACPNECLGRGACSHGFCHCNSGYWGLDCGLSSTRLGALAARGGGGGVRPRVFVYEVPPALRRSCAPWTFSDDLGDRLLASDHLEPNASRAELFWIYGCPNGDTVLPGLRWVKTRFPHWAAAVRAGVARHVMAVGHEEGWAEVWSLLGRWIGPSGDHGNHRGLWDDLHPASPSRQLVSLQLSGMSDYTADGSPRRRGVSHNAACRICFQPGKDVAVPGFPGVMDYPDDHGRPALYAETMRSLAPRRGLLMTARTFLTGTPTRWRAAAATGASRSASASCSSSRTEMTVAPPRRASSRRACSSPERCRPRRTGRGCTSRRGWCSTSAGRTARSAPTTSTCGRRSQCWSRSRAGRWSGRSTRGRSRGRRVPPPWVSPASAPDLPWIFPASTLHLPRTSYRPRGQASLCAVPEGKIGSYGHRATNALLLGCVPLVTKELFSYSIFHEAIDWSSISLHVPPAQMPALPALLARTDVEALRRAAAPLRRRLLWTSIYGDCHFRKGEGGEADAFDTLMDVLRTPRRQAFSVTAAHKAPRAPELLDELFPWLRRLPDGAACTKGFQCFDEHRRSCAKQL